MKKKDTAKTVYYITLGIAVVLLPFLLGLHSASTGSSAYVLFQKINKDIETFFTELPVLTGARPIHYLQASRYDGSGVTVNESHMASDDYILLTGYFEGSVGLRLVRRDGSLVASWDARHSEDFPDASFMDRPPATDWNIMIDGAVALPDGSVVYSYDSGGLVKRDRCGAPSWTLPKATHHSLVLAEDGGFWLPGRLYIPKGEERGVAPFIPPFKEDTILKVSATGKVEGEVSLPQILYDNGLEALLTASGHTFRQGEGWDREIIHLNKIAVLSSELAPDFPGLEAGDLALSLRTYNLLIIVDPDDWSVKWHQTGPWIRQHDPEFTAGGKLTMFNNNIYYSAYGPESKFTDVSTPRVSNIIEYDWLSGTTRIVYGESPGQELLSVIRGKIDIRANGSIMISEFDGGRAVQIDRQGRIVWQYINRFNREYVAAITEAIVYPAHYFDLQDWSC